MKDYIITAPNEIIRNGKKKDEIFVFLAGAIQSTPDEWQFTVPQLDGVTYLSPRRPEKIERMSPEEWKRQYDWETLGLRVSDVILFWIPSPDPNKLIKGRDYAQTSRMELLENLARGKKIILGIADNIHARNYMVQKAKDYGISVVHSTLENCLDELRLWLKNRKSNVWFTSDTHFNQQRTLELSLRPFKDLNDMNMALIENWNNCVGINDNLIFAGDWGSFDYLKYLNGNIIFILGNYERKDMLDRKMDFVDYHDWLTQDIGFSNVHLNYTTYTINTELNDGTNYVKEVKLIHEPSKFYQEPRLDWALFGHCHQIKMKKWGYNVGVDVNNYAPISEKDVAFYLRAIEKFYDEETWI